ncbi:MAG: hypothetical protein OEZ34_12280 [Spirochaetia bacterium]|nr:hypothetical protein [Spirochaetia bacterium]
MKKPGFFLNPVYNDTAFFYENTGSGTNSLTKSQNVYNLRHAGLHFGYQFSNHTAGIYATARHRITSRYYKYNKQYDDYFNAGIVYFYYENPLFSIDSGRIFHSVDDGGFLLVTESPGIRTSAGFKGLLENFRISALYLDLSREEFLRSKKKGSYSDFSGLELLFETGKFFASFFGGYYHVHGRMNISDYRYGKEPEAVLPTGQSNVYDTGIHYYILKSGYDSSSRLKFDLTGIYHTGYRYDRAFWSSNSNIYPLEIKGGMLYMSVLYRFMKLQYSDDCSGFFPGLCAVPVIENGPLMGLSGLVTSKDKDSRDFKLTGFGSIRPSVNVMGGPASILINGDFLHPSPFRNYQPGNVFYNGPVLENEFRDNTDPSMPEYSSRMEMVSLRSAVVLKKFSLNLFVSRALYGDISGKEGVLLLSRSFTGFGMNASFFLGASSAEIKYIEKDPGIIFNRLRKEEYKNFIRYSAGVFFRI